MTWLSQASRDLRPIRNSLTNDVVPTRRLALLTAKAANLSPDTFNGRMNSPRLRGEPRAEARALHVGHAGEIPERHGARAHRVQIDQIRVAARIVDGFQHDVLRSGLERRMRRLLRVARHAVRIGDSQHLHVAHRLRGARISGRRSGHRHRDGQRHRYHRQGPGEGGERLPYLHVDEEVPRQPPPTMMSATSSHACGCPVSIG